MAEHPETAAEAYLATLAARDVDWIFGNAGTDFAPLIEAVAAGEISDAKMPRTVEVLHETVAVAMAHGYYLMTVKPQCVMVHVNVGVANALMGIINAYRGNVPILFASGRTPITEQGRLGSRNLPIHWGQEMFDQGGLVREFVKWDNELAGPGAGCRRHRPGARNLQHRAKGPRLSLASSGSARGPASRRV